MNVTKGACRVCALPVDPDERVRVCVRGVWAHQRCFERNTGRKLGARNSERLQRAGWRLVVNPGVHGP